MNHASLLAAGLLLATVTACGAAQDIVYKDPDIAKYKSGNRVALAHGDLVSDVVAIEMLKHGKFQLAGTVATPKAEAPKPAVDAKGAVIKGAAPAAAAPVASSGSYDYLVRVNALLYAYTPINNTLGTRYSFSVTTKTGEIVFIKVLYGADLKTSLKETFDEVASLLL